eukprot:TRINITY_DN3314_c0_g1_i4.p1 TRINITY_DN3314_c0_g1~~TRINITY_DN3314_c0_g1_i4.p1  ORF type:complete len:764 (-),score=175.76 TRINITY_DN3314_c0_g1_i4:10-2301(-)
MVSTLFVLGSVLIGYLIYKFFKVNATESTSLGGLSESQLATLRSICDAFISDESRSSHLHASSSSGHSSPLQRLSDANPARKAFFARKATDIGVHDHLIKTVLLQPPEKIGEFKQLLSLLNTYGLTYLLTGQIKPFTQLTLAEQQKILSDMGSSNMGLRRKAYKGLAPLVYRSFFAVLDKVGNNANWEAIGYAPPSQYKDMPPPPALKIEEVKGDKAIKCDVVIVGSGAGGGVAAAVLAQAGHKVVVLEKGPFCTEADFTWREPIDFGNMYERGGLMVSESLEIAVLAGSTVGGGTTINWAASFRTPQAIIDQWSQAVPGFFDQPDYKEALDAVCARLNVGINENVVNAQNEVLRKGCEREGYDFDHIPRNVRGCSAAVDSESACSDKKATNDDCGYCSLGCRRGAKQGTMRTWLQDACANGAVIVPNCFVEKIIHADGKVQGVIGRVSPPTTETISGPTVPEHLRGSNYCFHLTVHAKTVICSAGALHSPALLLRSHIQNTQIGKNLYLHPVAIVAGTFDKKIEAWKGPPMSIISREFNNLDGSHYGCIIETPSTHPALMSSGLACSPHIMSTIKHRMLESDKLVNFVCICRDKDGGEIRIDSTGLPVVHYALSDYDWGHLRASLVGAVRIMVAAGSQEVGVAMTGLPHVKPTMKHTKGSKQEPDEAVEKYIEKFLAIPYQPNRQFLASAHQMGTCRMGTDSHNSVVNTRGQVWGIEGLYVADTSVFPSALGVNPMVTAESVSYKIAKGICATLKTEIEYEK